MKISQVIMSYTQPNFDKGYLGQFVSELFDSLHSTLQYEVKIFVTMAIHCVPDLSDIKGFSGRL